VSNCRCQKWQLVIVGKTVLIFRSVLFFFQKKEHQYNFGYVIVNTLIKPIYMKLMSEWFDGLIENVTSPKNWSSVFFLVLLVLALGAGSLYMLINSPA